MSTMMPRTNTLRSGIAALLLFGAAMAVAPGLSSAQAGPDPVQVADSLSRLIHRGVVTGEAAVLQAARTLAERALIAHPGHPLLEHHLAATLYREASPLLETNPERGQELLEEASTILQQTVEREDALPETHALRASVIGMQITNPLKGMTMGPKANRALDRAMALSPENPRVWLAQGISTLHTPSFMGGGPDRAIEDLRRGIAALESDRPAPGHPIGGGAELWAWVGVAHMRADRESEAVAAFRRALEMEPEYAWVRYVLLPEAENRAHGSEARARRPARSRAAGQPAGQPAIQPAAC